MAIISLTLFDKLFPKHSRAGLAKLDKTFRTRWNKHGKKLSFHYIFISIQSVFQNIENQKHTKIFRDMAESIVSEVPVHISYFFSIE